MIPALDSACAEMEVQLDTDIEVPQEAIDTARKFGVELGDQPIEPESYVIAFLKQFLIQREKLEHGLLNQYLNQGTPWLWEKLLSSLEERNRKLLKVDTGSVIFTLFCPTEKSFLQLSNIRWRTRMVHNLQGLLDSLGNHRLILFPFLQSCFGDASKNIDDSQISIQMFQNWSQTIT